MRTIVLLSVGIITLLPSRLADAQSPSKDDATRSSITNLVQEAMRAGWLRHDVAGYLAPWAPNARYILGRSATPSRHDVVLPFEKLKDIRALRYRGRPLKSRTLDFTKVNVVLKGKNTAHLTMTVRQGIPGGAEKVQEIYHLRKTKERWQIVFNRTWPLEVEIQNGKPVLYSADVWKQLDQMVERVKTKGDLILLARALLTAYRYAEAHRAAQKQTRKKTATGTDWALRGVTAALSGDARDATRSFKKAVILDPKTAVPGYARGLK